MTRRGETTMPMSAQDVKPEEEESWLVLYNRDPIAAQRALGGEPAGKGGYYDRSKPWNPGGNHAYDTR